MRGLELPKALLTKLRYTIHLEEEQHGHRPLVGIFLGPSFPIVSLGFWPPTYLVG